VSDRIGCENSLGPALGNGGVEKMLTDKQRRLLNEANGNAIEIRKRIEALRAEDLEHGEHLSLAVLVTNLTYDLQKAIK
jgi:hypothetical protein